MPVRATLAMPHANAQRQELMNISSVFLRLDRDEHPSSLHVIYAIVVILVRGVKGP
jgi:hypothetical protein